MDLVSIGEFARMSRLSPKALRLYDDLELLPPARVDVGTGYRWYSTEQLERARLVASLRRIGVPLAQIKTILDAEPGSAGKEIARYWADVETEHAARRELAGLLIDQSDGKRSAMYEVCVRDIPERRVLCQQRHATSESEVIAFGKEIIGLFKGRDFPMIDGIAGAAFLIYHGEVSEDSDGPVEWCRPVPDDEAEAVASTLPSLSLRIEPAHKEAYVHLGTDELSAAQWQVVSETLHAWGSAENRLPSKLGVRLTFFAPRPRTADSRPDCDFAVPLR